MNEIRSGINRLLSRAGQHGTGEGPDRTDVMAKLHEDLIGLLRPKRHLLAEECDDLVWGPYAPGEIPLNPNNDGNDGADGLPPHQYLQLLHVPPLDTVLALDGFRKELRKRKL